MGECENTIWRTETCVDSWVYNPPPLRTGLAFRHYRPHDKHSSVPVEFITEQDAWVCEPGLLLVHKMIARRGKIAVMHYNPYWTLMTNWWWINGKEILPASKSDWQLDSNVPKGCTWPWLLQLVLLAWASVTILGRKLLFWGKNLWNETLYEKEENIMLGIIMPGF